MATAFLLRQTWPDNAHIFSVLNREGEPIGRINCDQHAPSGCPKWHWNLNYHRSRNMPSFSGRCDSLDECKAEIRAHYADFMDALENDGHLERVRREKRGVPTVMFFYNEEYDAAPQAIEDLAGCLEGTVEEARLSLLVDSVAHWERRLEEEPDFRGRRYIPFAQAGDRLDVEAR